MCGIVSGYTYSSTNTRRPWLFEIVYGTIFCQSNRERIGADVHFTFSRVLSVSPAHIRTHTHMRARAHIRTHGNTRMHTCTHSLAAATIFAQFTSLYWLRSSIRQKLSSFGAITASWRSESEYEPRTEAPRSFERPKAERNGTQVRRECYLDFQLLTLLM